MIETNFKHTDIGPIPHDWEVMALSEIGTFFRGHGIVRKDSNSGNISALRYGEIYTTHHNYVKEYVSHISREVANDSFRLKIGDICFAGYGETLQDIGKAVAITKEEEAYAGQNIVVLRPSKRISAIYFGYMLNMPNIAIQKANRGNGSSIMLITPKALSEILTPIPESEDEQMRIGKALSDIDELIGGLRKLIEKKRNIKQGAMSRLLSGSLRLPGFNQQWRNYRIGDLSSVQAGATPSTEKSEYWDGDIRWMNSGEINLKYVREVENRITQNGYDSTSTHMLPKYCVLLGLAGQGKTRGTAAINMIELCTNQSIAAIYPSESFNSFFLYHLLDSKYNDLRMLSSGEGTRGGLTKKQIEGFYVFMPTDLAEQTAIAKVLTDMDAEIEKLEKKLAKYKQVKQGMMKQLLTGKIRLI